MRSAFTLVELLVVVALIALLLALLAPAMERAIYQAELAICGARLDAASSGVTSYTFDFRRRYPYRTLVHDYDAQFSAIVNPSRLTWRDPLGRFDDRKPLKGYLSINGSLNCPLSAKLDLEIDSATDTSVTSHYAMWWGWRYTTQAGGPQQGMVRLGDKFQWNGVTGGDNGYYSVLVSDSLKRNFPNQHLGQGSHQDKLGVWDPDGPQQSAPAGDSGDVPGGGAIAGYITSFYWRANGKRRGPIDVNYAMSDGSMLQYVDVPRATEHRRGLREISYNRDPDQAAWSGGYIVPPN